MSCLGRAAASSPAPRARRPSARSDETPPPAPRSHTSQPARAPPISHDGSSRPPGSKQPVGVWLLVVVVRPYRWWWVEPGVVDDAGGRVVVPAQTPLPHLYAPPTPPPAIRHHAHSPPFTPCVGCASSGRPPACPMMMSSVICLPHQLIRPVQLQHHVWLDAGFLSSSSSSTTDGRAATHNAGRQVPEETASE